MEADWSVEVGNDLPVIAVPWESFVDLRDRPELIASITEVAGNEALSEALMVLNASALPVFTSKCDCWLLTADEIDPLEFEAECDDAQRGIGCYIDILSRDLAVYRSFSAHEKWVRRATLSLRAMRQPQAKVEFVVRPALMLQNNAADEVQRGFGITLYVYACAAEETAAKEVFQIALRTATTITMQKEPIAGE